MTNPVTKALIVNEPWLGLILDGRKTWEMRSTRTAFRGWFGLIPKGSGEVWGVARLVDSPPPLTRTQLLAGLRKHRMARADVSSGRVGKWNKAWVIADARRLRRPVPYVHKSGAVIWVNLDRKACAAIARQFKPPRPATAKTG